MMDLNKELVGQRIKDVRPMTKEEMEKEGWYGEPNPPSVLVLENGIVIYPSRDDEGNGAGTLFSYNSKTEKFYTIY